MDLLECQCLRKSDLVRKNFKFLPGLIFNSSVITWFLIRQYSTRLRLIGNFVSKNMWIYLSTFLFRFGFFLSSNRSMQVIVHCLQIMNVKTSTPTCEQYQALNDICQWWFSIPNSPIEKYIVSLSKVTYIINNPVIFALKTG